MTINNNKKIEPPNLGKSAVQRYWEGRDRRMGKVLHVMENVEDWVVDDVESVARELVNLGRQMSTASKRKLTRHAQDLMMVMAYISCGKALRLLNWLDEVYPGLTFHYAMEARQIDNEDAPRLMLDRLRTMNNLGLLSKVFAPARSRLILELLADEES